MSYTDQRTAIENLTDDAERMLRSSSDTYAQALADRYQEISDRLVADITRIIDEANQGGTPSYSSFLEFQGHAKTMDAISREVMRLNRDVIPSLQNQLVQQYKDAYNQSAWVLDQVTPPNIDVNYVMPPENQIRQYVSSEWNSAMFSQRIGTINDMMAQDIQQEVLNAMLTGQSNQDLARDIRNVIGDGDTGFSKRAKMIARTESARAANLANNHFLDQNEKYIEDWIWVSRSVSSPRICDDCAERSGETYDSVKEIAAEQGAELDPPLHPNCSCQWMAKPKKWSDLLGPELSKGIDDKPWWQQAYNDGGQVKNQTPMEYQDWADQFLEEFEK